MRYMTSVVVGMAVTARSLGVAAAFEPVTVKRGGPPLVVAEAHGDLNGDGKPDTLTIALVQGRRYNDAEPWCGMGWKDEGRFTIAISIVEGPTRVHDLNGIAGVASLWFYVGGSPLELADYNHDGQADVAVWQYGGCASSDWFLLTIDATGGVARLCVGQGKAQNEAIDAEEIVLTRDGFRTHGYFDGKDLGRDYVWDAAKGAFVERSLPNLPTITIMNMSPMDVAHVYIAKPEDTYWGEDWLGDTDFLEVGTAWEFDVLPGVDYWVKVTDDDDTTLEQWEGVLPPTGLRIGEEGHAVIELINGSEECIGEVVVGQWGRLAFGEMIAPGDKRVVFVAPGTYDLSAEGCEGTLTVEKKQVKVTDRFSWVISAKDVQRHPRSVPRFIHCKPSASGTGYITVQP
jgi:hypothetical protein